MTTVALAWGTLTVVLLLAFGEGLGNQMRKGFQGFASHSVIIKGSGQTSVSYRGLPKGRRINLAEEDVTLLKNQIPEIELISPENDRWGNSISYGKKTVNALVVGVYPCFGEMRIHFPERGGRFINESDMKDRRRVIFLGDQLKKDIFGDKEDAVGKVVSINNIPFTVIGVMEKKMQNSMYQGPDANKATIPFSTFSMMLKKSGYEYIDRMIYRPKDVNQAKKIEQAVYSILGGKYKFDPKDESALSVWDTIENEKGLSKISLGMEIFLIILGGMSLIAGGVGVANISFATVRQRTREIGIKIALGAQRKDILIQFLGESLIICLWGGCIGMALSFSIIYLFLQIPFKEGGSISVADFLAHPVISIETIIITVLILSVIGIMAGFFPARRATKLNPVEALRYE